LDEAFFFFIGLQFNKGSNVSDEDLKNGRSVHVQDGHAPRSAHDALQPREAPQPPKRSRHAHGRIVVFFHFLMSLLVFIALAALVATYFGKLRFEEPGPLQIARTFVIKDGSSLPRIAEQLRSGGVIDNDLIFRLGVRAYNAASKMKPGEYLFEPRMSMYDVMNMIRDGRAVTHRISFPEGLTTYQIFERLRENDVLTGELPENLPAEGSLMPDTYPFQRGTTRMEIVQQMQRAQDRFVKTIWDRRIEDLPVTTPEQMVTLASIVEKETGRADERPRVASVFLNRLKLGMRLQSDPTIIYGLFGGEGKPSDRPIYKSDIDRVTPYNTYQIDGLPPGPIANPGRAALEAVANPSRTNDLFFVADGTGGHAFAVTVAEHNENVKRWREIEQRMKDAAAKVEQPAGTAPDGADITGDSGNTEETGNSGAVGTDGEAIQPGTTQSQ
jgi:UPF0755 protein